MVVRAHGAAARLRNQQRTGAGLYISIVRDPYCAGTRVILTTIQPICVVLKHPVITVFWGSLLDWGGELP